MSKKRKMEILDVPADSDAGRGDTNGSATIAATTEVAGELTGVIPLSSGERAMVPVRVTHTPMDLLSIALSNSAGIDVIERIAALQRETLAREAETQFNEAMSRVQDRIKRVAPDLENTQKKSRYASYAAIDRAIRPIYSAEGFSLSFTHAESPKPDFIRVICRCARGAHKEMYQVDWPVDTKGPQGAAVMTATQATGASDSYAKRYLVKDIFNIAIGEDDTDGEIPEDADFLAQINGSGSLEELKNSYTAAMTDALKRQAAKSVALFMEARKKKQKELGAA